VGVGVVVALVGHLDVAGADRERQRLVDGALAGGLVELEIVDGVGGHAHARASHSTSLADRETGTTAGRPRAPSR
jgi:hypothetical protein